MSQTFSVLSLLPLTSNLLSADQATWYTDPTWPRRDIKYLHVGRKNDFTAEGKKCHKAPPTGQMHNCILYSLSMTSVRCSYFPVRPSQILIDLSNEADARSLVSGEKSTSLTRALWPVNLARGFFSSAGFHRNKVKSSEPDTKRSGAVPCRNTTAVSKDVHAEN